MRKLKIPNELGRFFNSLFITIAVLFILFVVLNLEGIDGQYDKLFSLLGSVGSLFIGYGAYQIAKEQKKSTEFKISEEEKIIIRKNYEDIFAGIQLIFNNYSNRKNLLAAKLSLDKAANYAELNLPKDIEDYTKELYKNVSDLYQENCAIFTIDGSLRINCTVENYDIIWEKLWNTNPNKVYSKHLKIKK